MAINSISPILPQQTQAISNSATPSQSATQDTTSPLKMTVVTSKTVAEDPDTIRFEEALLQSDRVNIIQPKKDGGVAMAVIENEWQGIQKDIQKQRPDLSKADWDFSMGGDGKFRVTGPLSEQDTQWLEKKLNGDTALQNAAIQFNKAAQTYYTSDNGLHSWIGNSFMHGGRKYENVAQQVSGIKFKELMTRVDYVAKTGDSLLTNLDTYAKTGVVIKEMHLSGGVTQYQLGEATGEIKFRNAIELAGKFLIPSQIRTSA
jgi:hypothetical protein